MSVTSSGFLASQATAALQVMVLPAVEAKESSRDWGIVLEAEEFEDILMMLKCLKTEKRGIGGGKQGGGKLVWGWR